jgi:hypothetical protein
VCGLSLSGLLENEVVALLWRKNTPQILSANEPSTVRMRKSLLAVLPRHETRSLLLFSGLQVCRKYTQGVINKGTTMMVHLRCGLVNKQDRGQLLLLGRFPQGGLGFTLVVPIRLQALWNWGYLGALALKTHQNNDSDRNEECGDIDNVI